MAHMADRGRHEQVRAHRALVPEQPLAPQGWPRREANQRRVPGWAACVSHSKSEQTPPW
jgi:hypothetical protein